MYVNNVYRTRGDDEGVETADPGDPDVTARSGESQGESETGTDFGQRCQTAAGETPTGGGRELIGSD